MTEKCRLTLLKSNNPNETTLSADSVTCFDQWNGRADGLPKLGGDTSTGKDSCHCKKSDYPDTSMLWGSPNYRSSWISKIEEEGEKRERKRRREEGREWEGGRKNEPSSQSPTTSVGKMSSWTSCPFERWMTPALATIQLHERWTRTSLLNPTRTDRTERRCIVIFSCYAWGDLFYSNR